MKVQMVWYGVNEGFQELVQKMLEEQFGYYGRPWGWNSNRVLGVEIDGKVIEGLRPFFPHPSDMGEDPTPSELAEEYMRENLLPRLIRWTTSGGNWLEVGRDGIMTYCGRRHALADFLRFFPQDFQWQSCSVLEIESQSDAPFWVAGVLPRS